jgi:hypothetical protein
MEATAVNEVTLVNDVSTPAPQGEIKHLALQLIELAAGVPDIDLGRQMIVLCHEIIAVGADFADRTQRLAARSFDQQAQIFELQRQLAAAQLDHPAVLEQLGIEKPPMNVDVRVHHAD